MADFAFFSNAVPGHKMCCHCFDSIPIDKLWRDWRRRRWDVCRPCKRDERRLLWHDMLQRLWPGS